MDVTHMTPEQIATLNSMVTFAAENIPGELSDEEKAIAKIVGSWALYPFAPRGDWTHLQGKKTHDYKIVSASFGETTEDVANQWATRGWRVVGVISNTRHQFILERPVGVSHPDD